jgi:Fic family protein
MYTGINELSRTGLITSNLAVRIMQTMKRTTAGLRNTAGVKLVNPTSQKVIYTPPDHQVVPDKLKNWEAFVNEESELDALVRMAIMHYQFEAIHPFADGNGRTGRILNVLFLVKEKRLNLPVLYHSAYIIQHKNEYYRSLREVSEEGNWQQWILYMLEAVEETARNTLNLVKSIIKLKDEMLRIIQSHPHKMPAHDLAELLFTYPYIKSKTLMEKGLGTRPTASRYLSDLEQAGLLDTLKVGREIYFVNFRLLNLLSGRPKM